MQRAGRDGFSGRRGFTMIEMLTVIAIIAILAGILFPVFATVRRNVHKATCTSNLHQIYQALKIYKDDHGTYPDALYGFATSAGQNGGTTQVLGLYPQYVKSNDIFHCPLSPYPLNSTVTLQGVPPTPGAFVNRFPSRLYPAWDSYDGQVEPSKVGAPYNVKYVKHWSNLNIGFGDVPKQLLYKNPPEDTVVTWCTYHRDYLQGTDQPQTGSLDIVLFLDGHVKPIPSNKMYPISTGNGVVPTDHSYLVNRD
jgi:prepilin-type N-terminal cleavage/methylation domain-containing protein